jgi:hypothetical protein
MKTFEIENLLSKVKWRNFMFLGCFPADRLPSPHTFNAPVCFLANVDISSEAGSHWVAFLISKDNVLEYFCPLGISFYHWPLFLHYIRNVINPDKILFNLNRIQSLDSKTCGQLCIEFIISRDRGQSFITLLNKFSKNTISNDIKAIHFVKKLKQL